MFQIDNFLSLEDLCQLQGLGKRRGKDDTRKRDEVAVAARAGNVDGLTRALPAWLEPIKKN